MKEKPPFKYLILFALLSALSLFFFFRVDNGEISKKDQRILEPFLKDLVLNNHFGYVLVGEKPVSVASYFSHEPFANLIFHRKAHRFNFLHACKTFEKHKSKLNSGNFLFSIEKTDRYVTDEDVYTITIINKKVFLATVEKNLDLFKDALGDWITPSALLDQMIKTKIGLFDALKRDEGLYGVLLGYGRTNAIAFKRYLELAQSVDPYFRETIAPFSLRSITPSFPFHSLEEEYASFQMQFSFFDLQLPLSPFTPPQFKALANDETSDLKEKYRKAHRELLKIYAEKDFFQVTLEQLLDH